ncbi:family 43 glycosyl hydrolase [Boeremia exigua]|uniref:family 43 glycosyl hydrolase n=1 Tax=Boeremia exigua TaxID=749465 RepID=UPI001E8EACBA|nr:family 43 glycosyl hydrolase [Boeremia exigua]KAH6621703.1 family 43 glycosyl hydrolase [Boeremia exigua]
MLSLWKLLLGGALAIVSVAPGVNGQTYPGPGPVSGSTFAHDPTVIKTTSGGYLMAYTAPGIALKTSTDRTNWRDAGLVWTNANAPWTQPYTGGNSENLWAPDLSYHNGRYYLYYSASTFGSRKSAIFLATSTTGAAGSWTNQGVIIETNANSAYNAIDPNLIVDAEGKWWLSFGSFGNGLKLISINPSTGKRSGSNMVDIASRGSSGAIEAPVISRHGNYYYLWVSFDACCQGAASTYNIRVGRSTNVQGPYIDRSGKQMMSSGGTLMLASHGSIRGPGHNTVFTDNDADVLVYHYYRQSDGQAQLGINLIRYESDWPVIY